MKIHIKSMIPLVLAFVCHPVFSGECIGPLGNGSNIQTDDSGVEDNLKVMTFNISYDFSSDGVNHWVYRKPYINEMLQSYDLDLFGTQENDSIQLAELKEMLPEYTAYSMGIGTKYKYDFNCSLFFKTDRFEPLNDGYFWLHPNQEPSELAWGAKFPRLATWAVLKDKRTDLEFMVMVTHLDHYSKLARLESAKLIRSKIEEFSGGRPYFVMGDFNALPNSPAVQIFENSKLGRSKAIAEEIAGTEWTFHNWGKTPENKRRTIDYVLVSPGITVPEYRVVDGVRPDGVYLSDHNPLYVELKIPLN